MRRSVRGLAVISAVAALVLVLSATGCRSKTAAEVKAELQKLKEKEKEKPKEPFDPPRVYTEPGDRESQPLLTAVKPGHWAGVLFEERANLFDFSGSLTSLALDKRDNPIELEYSRLHLVTSRPAVLPKGQAKTLEAIFYPPRLGRSTRMLNQWRDRQAQGERFRDLETLTHLPSYQYFMFVLAKNPNRYRFLKVLDSVRPPTETVVTNPDDGYYYRVIAPAINPPLALPSQPLCWTSTAYVLWDDVPPNVLVPDQQQAMLDWLHWGGGLVISGPQTLDALRGSFLDPYLPASGSQTVTLDDASLAELNEHWTLATLDGDEKLKAVKPWPGVKLEKHADAQFLPGTGELVVERAVGRGRIVATAFRLTQAELISWRSFDSFCNGCIFRRPPRRFGPHEQQFTFVSKDGAAPGRLEPEVASNVRYFTRDVTSNDDLNVRRAAARQAEATAKADNLANFQQPFGEEDSFELAKYESGVAGWNDQSVCSSAARAALTEAAGISVPKREFVLWMIGIYLVAIAPLNWLVFRLLGRVEWAWLAVPAMAAGWGMAVIWLAQLDIGFARAETEIAVLEMQSGYPRAHLTRYSALYTSLSTTYAIHFEGATALAQPFSVDHAGKRGQMSASVDLQTVGENQLSGYVVSSNSTGMIHSEQMFDAGGELEFRASEGGPSRIVNNTAFRLSGAVVLRRRLRGDVVVNESAWIGDLKAGATVEVLFESHDGAQLAGHREQAPLTCKVRPEGSLSLHSLVEISENFASLAPGDVRLVAWRDEALPGMRVMPAASQARAATLIVANLQFGVPPQAERDQNLRQASQFIDDTDPQ